MKKKSKKEDAVTAWYSKMGKANVKKHGKGHMSKIIQDYWKSPAGKARRAVAKSRSKDLVTKN